MILRIKYLFLIWVLLFAECTPTSDEKKSSDNIVTVWLIGDSTVADYSKYADYEAKRYPKSGWGQVFQSYMSGKNLSAIKEWVAADSVLVENRAVGGRSTRTFFQEGKWRVIYDSLKPGDFVLIQFGHNDASIQKPERYVDTNGYKEFLRLFISQTRQKGAIPVLITPVARNHKWEEGKLKDVHGDYALSMKEIAKETSTDIIDLNELSMKYFSEKGREYVTENYFMNLPSGKYEAYPEGLNDNTHFQPEGAKVVAGLVYEGLKELAKQNLEEK